MAIMLKIQWDIKEGREEDFRANQRELCSVMYEHPGVISYHVDYPADNTSQWTEIYANDDAFQAHLANEKGKAPLGGVIDASETITCRCWGSTNDTTKEMLAGFGTTYHETSEPSFIVNPLADKDSAV